MSFVKISLDIPGYGTDRFAWLETTQVQSLKPGREREQSCKITMQGGEEIYFSRWAEDVAKDLQVIEQPDLPDNIIAILKELVSDDEDGPDIPRRMVSQIKGYLNSKGLV